jgi:hypothetical protein
VHGVFELIVAQPMKAVPFEDIDPAFWHRHAIEHRTDGLGAYSALCPLSYAMAAGIEIGVYIERNTVDVVRDFVVLERVVEPPTRFGRYGRSLHSRSSAASTHARTGTTFSFRTSGRPMNLVAFA